MVTSNRYALVIDPGGTPPVRTEGINLLVYPEQGSLQRTVTPLTSQGQTYTGQEPTASYPDRFSFTASTILNSTEWKRLESLVRWQRETRGLYEIVLYWLWTPVTELTQTRLAVPTVDTETENLGNQTLTTYYPVIQGDLWATGEFLGSDCYRVNLQFVEGTLIPPT